MSSPQEGSTRIVFLGGLGEVGRNMMALESSGRLLVVDCGLSFPTEEMLGVDLVLPDYSYVAERADSCLGVVLTHGHEDHVGALSWFLRAVDVPVYGTPLTLGIARRRLDEFGVSADLRQISDFDTLELGSFRCSFLAVSHSIPDSVALVVESPGGRILYTGDYKLDDSPIDGRKTDIEGFRRTGERGVDLMLSDSTNALTPGRTQSESVVGERLKAVFAAAPRRIIVACFASNLHRIQQVCAAAEQTGRVVAFVGRSMIANAEVGRDLGHLDVDDATIIGIDQLDNHPPERTVVICTGSQGEPLSALSLIAAREHKLVRVEPSDVVVLSASAIPGNESAVHRVINELYRSGAEVHSAESSAVHVSGHASADELADMVTLVSPRHFCPVHGEYRQLATHARIARESGVAEKDITIVEDGDVLVLDSGRVRRGDRVRAGMVLVDGLGVGDVGPVVLRDRRHLAEDGILVCVLTIDSQTGEILAGPDLISRGFVFMDNSRDFLDEAADGVYAALESLEADKVTDWSAIKKACRRSLGEFVWTRTRRRPMILPLITEI
ncbi:MAG: ribonuclease J [Actinomycetota bacterium]|nr:ribonuclease J [Actinomycetota bacterium]